MSTQKTTVPTITVMRNTLIMLLRKLSFPFNTRCFLIPVLDAYTPSFLHLTHQPVIRNNYICRNVFYMGRFFYSSFCISSAYSGVRVVPQPLYYTFLLPKRLFAAPSQSRSTSSYVSHANCITFDDNWHSPI